MDDATREFLDSTMARWAQVDTVGLGGPGQSIVDEIGERVGAGATPEFAVGARASEMLADSVDSGRSQFLGQLLFGAEDEATSSLTFADLQAPRFDMRRVTYVIVEEEQEILILEEEQVRAVKKSKAIEKKLRSTLAQAEKQLAATRRQAATVAAERKGVAPISGALPAAGTRPSAGALPAAGAGTVAVVLADGTVRELPEAAVRDLFAGEEPPRRTVRPTTSAASFAAAPQQLPVAGAASRATAASPVDGAAPAPGARAAEPAASRSRAAAGRAVAPSAAQGRRSKLPQVLDSRLQRYASQAPAATGAERVVMTGAGPIALRSGSAPSAPGGGGSVGAPTRSVSSSRAVGPTPRPRASSPEQLASQLAASPAVTAMLARLAGASVVGGATAAGPQPAAGTAPAATATRAASPAVASQLRRMAAAPWAAPEAIALALESDSPEAAALVAALSGRGGALGGGTALRSLVDRQRRVEQARRDVAGQRALHDVAGQRAAAARATRPGAVAEPFQVPDRGGRELATEAGVLGSAGLPPEAAAQLVALARRGTLDEQVAARVLGPSGLRILSGELGATSGAYSAPIMAAMAAANAQASGAPELGRTARATAPLAGVELAAPQLAPPAGGAAEAPVAARRAARTPTLLTRLLAGAGRGLAASVGWPVQSGAAASAQGLPGAAASAAVAPSAAAGGRLSSLLAEWGLAPEQVLARGSADSPAASAPGASAPAAAQQRIERAVARSLAAVAARQASLGGVGPVEQFAGSVLPSLAPRATVASVAASAGGVSPAAPAGRSPRSGARGAAASFTRQPFEVVQLAYMAQLAERLEAGEMVGARPGRARRIGGTVDATLPASFAQPHEASAGVSVVEHPTEAERFVATLAGEGSQTAATAPGFATVASEMAVVGTGPASPQARINAPAATVRRSLAAQGFEGAAGRPSVRPAPRGGETAATSDAGGPAAATPGQIGWGPALSQQVGQRQSWFLAPWEEAPASVAGSAPGAMAAATGQLVSPSASAAPGGMPGAAYPLTLGATALTAAQRQLGGRAGRLAPSGMTMLRFGAEELPALMALSRAIAGSGGASVGVGRAVGGSPLLDVLDPRAAELVEGGAGTPPGRDLLMQMLGMPTSGSGLASSRGASAGRRTAGRQDGASRAPAKRPTLIDLQQARASRIKPMEPIAAASAASVGAMAPVSAAPSSSFLDLTVVASREQAQQYETAAGAPVMRKAKDTKSVAKSGESEEGGGEAPELENLDALVTRLYNRLKRRLSIERERRGG